MRPRSFLCGLIPLLIVVSVSSRPGSAVHNSSALKRLRPKHKNNRQRPKRKPHHHQIDGRSKGLHSKLIARKRKRVRPAGSHYWSATGEAILTYTNWTQKHDQKFLDTLTVLHPAPQLIFPRNEMAKSTHDWSYFDMAYIITLEGHENSRLKPALFEVSVKANIPLAEITVVKSKPDKAGVRGCFNAHKFVADHAMSHGYSRVVVFEDDVSLHLSRCTADRLRAVTDFLRRRDEHGGWDVFFFSTMTMTCHNTGVDSIKRIHSMTTAAYAMTRDTMQRLAVLPYSGGSVDVGFFSTLERCYGHYPMLIFQRDDIASTIKRRSNFQLRDNMERLFEFLCDERGYYAIFVMSYYMAHPSDYLLDTVPRIWDDRAARWLLVPVLSPFWAPVMLGAICIWHFGVSRGCLVAMSMVLFILIPFLYLGGKHMLVAFVNLMLWATLTIAAQAFLLWFARASLQCCRWLGPWYHEMRLMMARRHVIQQLEALKKKKNDDYALVAHLNRAPRWLFYLAIVLLVLGGVATAAGIFSAVFHKEAPPNGPVTCDIQNRLVPVLPTARAPERKALVTLTVTIDYLAQIKALIEIFGMEHFDFVIFHLESFAHSRSWHKDPVLGHPGVQHVWAEREAVYDKLSFARKFLTPEKVAPYSHVFLWDGDAHVPPTFRPLQYLQLVSRHRLVISAPGLRAPEAATCAASASEPARGVQKTAHVDLKYSVWRADWWAQVWRFIVSKYRFRHACLMLLPFKCIVDVGSFRDDLDSIVDDGEALLEEDRQGPPLNPDPSPNPPLKQATDWRNASFGIVTSQRIEGPGGPAMLLQQMMWDWSQVNRENAWFAEIIREFECEDSVLDARAMDGRSYCLTTMQRFNAAYANVVQSMMPRAKG